MGTKGINLQVTQTVQDEVLTIGLEGEIELDTVENVLQKVMEEAEEKERKKIICDLRKVSYLDSEGIKFFLRMQAYCKRIGGRLSLVCPSGSMTRRVFDMTGTKSIINLAKTMGDATALMM